MRRHLALVALFMLSSCALWDPPLGEIGMRVTDSGKLTGGCLIMVFNSAGRQIQQVPTDVVGVAYVRRLVPGTYTFKFSAGDRMFPAVRTVTIAPGASAFLPVELNDEKDPKGEAEASKSNGKDYGESDISP